MWCNLNRFIAVKNKNSLSKRNEFVFYPFHMDGFRCLIHKCSSKNRYNPKAIQTHTGIKLKIRSRKLKTFHVEWASDMWILSSILLNFVVFLNGMWNGFVQWVERKRECPTRYPASHRRWCGKRACETVNKWGKTGICKYIPVTRVRQT